jgi:hypothetical protein
MGRKSIYIPKKESVKLDEAVELLNIMKNRPTRENIRSIKREIKVVDISNGVALNTNSAT